MCICEFMRMCVSVCVSTCVVYEREGEGGREGESVCAHLHVQAKGHRDRVLLNL